jgi:hypothetical protein
VQNCTESAAMHMVSGLSANPAFLNQVIRAAAWGTERLPSFGTARRRVPYCLGERGSK